jgi:hypothetical protein
MLDDGHRNVLKILELVLAPLPHLCSECLVLGSCRWFAFLCKRYQILSTVKLSQYHVELGHSTMAYLPRK